MYEQANRLIMNFLPGVPYAHTKPALGFQRNIDRLQAEPRLAGVFRNRPLRRVGGGD